MTNFIFYIYNSILHLVIIIFIMDNLSFPIVNINIQCHYSQLYYRNKIV